MKFAKENKYLRMSIYAFLVIAASIVLWACLDNYQRVANGAKVAVSVFKPFVYGFVIAYIFNYPYKKFMSLFDKIKTKKPIKKGVKVTVCIILTYTLLLSAFALFMYLVVPAVVNALVSLLELAPGYIESTRHASEKWLAKYLSRFNVSASTLVNIMDGIVREYYEGFDMQNLVMKVITVITSAWEGVKNILLGLIISIYFLVDKHKFIVTGKKIVYACAGEKKGNRILDVLSFADKTFGGFIIAKIADSLIIGVICYVGMLILKLDNAVLISVIVGITNVIPFFGPFIGAVPSVLLFLASGSWQQALIFAVFILALQQFDGNVLGPKLLGDSTGIRAVYVVFAVIVGGGIFGIVGMFIGVPVFAIIYTLIAEYINDKIKDMNVDVE